jgi:hypothetical protein
LKFAQHLSQDDQRCIRYQAKKYTIISDTLYHRVIDDILHHCLTHEEVKLVLNDFHKGACGGHLFGLVTTQKILRVSYFWPTIFKDCIEAVKKCHPCQEFTWKMHSHPGPLHPVIIVGPFTKWGVDFVDCNPTSDGGHQHIIVVINYFKKWVEAMPTIKYDGKTATFFVFKQIIARFGISSEIVTDHGSHFQNEMMLELAYNMGFIHGLSSPYYPQENGQVEAINKSLKTILQKIVSRSNSNWHFMLYPTLWAYRTLVKTTIGFSTFQLMHGVDSILPVECEIPSLKLAVELLPDTSDLERCLVHLESLDEQRRDAFTAIEANKKHVKVQYDKFVCPRLYAEGDLVLLYDQAKEQLGAGKFKPMWHDPYIMRCVLEKEAYELEHYERNKLVEPRNGIYVKRYYA